MASAADRAPLQDMPGICCQHEESFVFSPLLRSLILLKAQGFVGSPSETHQYSQDKCCISVLPALNLVFNIANLLVWGKPPASEPQSLGWKGP